MLKACEDVWQGMVWVKGWVHGCPCICGGSLAQADYIIALAQADHIIAHTSAPCLYRCHDLISQVTKKPKLLATHLFTCSKLHSGVFPIHTPVYSMLPETKI